MVIGLRSLISFVIIRVINKTAKRESDLLITNMITDLKSLVILAM